MVINKYFECTHCKAVHLKNESNCSICGLSNVVTEVTELQGLALQGDKEYRIDTGLAMELNRFAGKPVVITIREETDA